MASTRSDAASDQTPKKVYTPPRLVAYGKLKDLTRGGGGAGGETGSGPMTMACWVAAVLYGPDDLRTDLLRAWVNGPYAQTGTGSVVVSIYRRYGQAVARLARRSRRVRALLQPLFDGGLRRAQRHYMGM